jgi:hypothetical protein
MRGGGAFLRGGKLTKKFIAGLLDIMCRMVVCRVGASPGIVGLVVAVGAGAAAAGAAWADNDFPLTGNYTQNVPCKGDGTDPVAVRVKISPQEIVSNVGICTILDVKHDGDTISTHVECKFPAGPLMGDISFTVRPDHTLDFVDRDGNYKAVLHRCPD